MANVLPPMKPKALAMYVAGGVVLVVISLLVISRISVLRGKVGISAPEPVLPPLPKASA